jgi:hypothetical protein
MNSARLLKHEPATAPGAGPRAWRSLLTHTHMLGGELRPPQNYENLVRWAAERQLDALGVGSPFVPESLHDYTRFEDKERDLYYSGSVVPESVKHAAAVAEMMAELNRLSAGTTCFYLDNETPKARYGHMWWVGWHHDFPEWHDYDQPFDRWMARVQPPGYDGPEPMPYERRPYMQIVAAQRQHGALGIWAHPTSWWRTPKGAFMTNIASEMPAHLVAEGFIDGLVIMGYDAYRPSYLSLWFHLLDLGYPVPGLAETDIGLSTKKIWNHDPLFLTWIPAGSGTLDTKILTDALRRREIVVSSGPVLDLQVDEKPIGDVAETGPDRSHTVVLRVQAGEGAQPLGRIELLGRGGQRLWSLDDPEPGCYTLTVPGSDAAGYLIAQAFGCGDLPEQKAAREIKRFAITNPVYLHPAGWTFPKALATQVNLHVGADSSFRGGTLTLESPAGEMLEQHRAHTGTLVATVPANSRIRLADGQGRQEIRYLINENARVMDLQRYLYRGQFLKDYSSLNPGEVPIKAFRLTDFQCMITDVEIHL